jgi:hypothetical protein
VGATVRVGKLSGLLSHHYLYRGEFFCVLEGAVFEDIRVYEEGVWAGV